MPKHVLSVNVKIDGQEEIDGLSLREGEAIERVMVEQRLGVPDYFSMDIKAMVNQSVQEMKVIDKLKPGMEVEIAMGYEEEGPIFIGEISYIEPRFGEEEMTVTISGYDYFHRLTRGTNSRTKGDGHSEKAAFGKFAGDIIGQANERKGSSSHGLSADAGSGTESNYIPQYEVNDYEFLQTLGVSTGFVSDSRNTESSKKVSFKEITVAGADVTVCRDKLDPADAVQCMDAEFSLSTVRQVAKVEVRGWHRHNKEPFCGKHEAVDTPGPIDGKAGHKIAGKAHWGSDSAGAVLTIVDVPVEDKAEADAMAKSIFNKLAMEFVRGTVRCEGRPSITPGKVVELKQFGSRFSGKYLVESAVHTIDGAAEDHQPYTTVIGVVRNSAPDS